MPCLLNFRRILVGFPQNLFPVFYWQDKQETDFVVREGRAVKRLINVCWDLTNDNKKREVAGLEEAMKKFGIYESELITLEYEDKIKTPSGTVRIKNFFNNFSN